LCAIPSLILSQSRYLSSLKSDTSEIISDCVATDLFESLEDSSTENYHRQI